MSHLLMGQITDLPHIRRPSWFDVAWLGLASTSNLGNHGSLLHRRRALSPEQEHLSGF